MADIEVVAHLSTDSSCADRSLDFVAIQRYTSNSAQWTHKKLKREETIAFPVVGQFEYPQGHFSIPPVAS